MALRWGALSQTTKGYGSIAVGSRRAAKHDWGLLTQFQDDAIASWPMRLRGVI